MSKSKRIKALEARVAALEASGKTVTPEPAETAEGVTLGVWWESNSGIWYRGPSPEPLAAVYPGPTVNIQVFTNAGVEPLGPFPTLSAAMLATDARLREAGVGLPETVSVGHDGALFYSLDMIAWNLDMEGPDVCRPCSRPVGAASTIHEALAILDTHKVDTAIARAQLRERERKTERPVGATAVDSLRHALGVDHGKTSEPTTLSRLLTLGQATGHPDDCGPIVDLPPDADGAVFARCEKCGDDGFPVNDVAAGLAGTAGDYSEPDPIATRKAAAEGRGWRFVEPGDSTDVWFAQHDSGDWARDSLPDLLDAIEAREAEQAKPAKDPRIVDLEARGFVVSCTVRQGPMWRAEAPSGQVYHGDTPRDLWQSIPPETKPARPLEGVVLSGEWAEKRADSHRMTDAPRDAEVWLEDGQPGLFAVWYCGSCLATGIGTRADAIEKARELGAEVAS